MDMDVFPADSLYDTSLIWHKHDGSIFFPIKVSITFRQLCFSDSAHSRQKQNLLPGRKYRLDLPQLIFPANKICIIISKTVI